ncbi:hypothetical protein K501DRAFT_332811 [Backusella circina FSU 941]|nr:hypothetical protein K501DRAFT_332811 [Backusella circina FSU 941]
MLTVTSFPAITTALIVHDNNVIYSAKKSPIKIEVNKALQYKQLVKSIKKCNDNIKSRLEKEKEKRKHEALVDELNESRKRERLLAEENANLKKQMQLIVDEKRKSEEKRDRLKEKISELAANGLKRDLESQLKSKVNGLNIEKKLLKEKQEKLEYCGRLQRECRMRANAENMELGTQVRELSAKLDVTLGSLKLEKQKNSDLKNEMCLLLESQKDKDRNEEEEKGDVDELVNATAAADIAMAELVKEEEREKAERSKTQNKPATPKERKKKKRNKAK